MNGNWPAVKWVEPNREIYLNLCGGPQCFPMHHDDLRSFDLAVNMPLEFRLPIGEHRVCCPRVVSSVLGFFNFLPSDTNSISTGPELWLIQRLSAKPHSWAVRALSNRRCQPSISYQSSFWWKNVCTRSSRFLLKAYPNRTESIGIVYFSSIRIGLSIDYQTS